MYIFPKELNCYVCHGKCLGIHCSNCLRCYCGKCASKNEVIDSCSSAMFIKMCSQCVQFQSSLEKWENFVAVRPVRREFINTVLIKILEWCGKIPRLLIENDSYFMKRIDSMHKPFSFLHVRQKVKNSLYRCSEELVMDLKVIQHILLASPKDNFDRKELREGSRYLDIVIRELRLVDECPSCVLYLGKMCQPSLLNSEKKHSNFSYPCPWPHAVVLARVRGHPLWPAKVLYYNSKKKIVHVIFFGTYERGFVDLKSIFHARDPQSFPDDYERIKKRIHAKSRQFDIAIKELKNYIECLRLAFPDKIRLPAEFKKPWLPKDGINQFDYNVFNPSKNNEPMLEEKKCDGCSCNEDHYHRHNNTDIDVPTMLGDFQDEKAIDTNNPPDGSEERDEIEQNVNTSHQDESDTLSVDSFDSNFDGPSSTRISLVHSSVEEDVSAPSFSENSREPVKDDSYEVADESTIEYEFPEYLEDGFLNDTLDSNDIALSFESDSSKHGESESKNEKSPSVSSEDLKRRALDDGLWKNLRVKLERYEAGDSSPEEASQPLTVTSEETVLFLMSSSECLSNSSIEITTKIYEELSTEASTNASSSSNSSEIPSKELNCNRALSEFSDKDDDESMSDIFPCIDHRIIDGLDNEID
ncbi:uncharacterized protein LOC141851544 [Brevipalpus obovatus]|uniref:uncharacterized protein LOC141851544 n=1 Tax=Brevipalpus obovatus TaxID=246614 RepID=UPI003D9EA92F